MHTAIQGGDMKRWMSVAGLVMVASLLSYAAEPNPTFARLQTLVGTWESKMPDGKIALTDVKSMSAGSALMMTQGDEQYGTMVTMIHPDGNRVMLTHYCSSKNQPRMVAEAMTDAKTIKFTFLDVTNLAEGQPGSMRGLVLSMPDNDHMSQTWTFRGADGKEMTETFNLVRKK